MKMSCVPCPFEIKKLKNKVRIKTTTFPSKKEISYCPSSGAIQKVICGIKKEKKEIHIVLCQTPAPK